MIGKRVLVRKKHTAREVMEVTVMEVSKSKNFVKLKRADLSHLLFSWEEPEDEHGDRLVEVLGDEIESERVAQKIYLEGFTQGYHEAVANIGAELQKMAEKIPDLIKKAGRRNERRA